MTPGSLQKFHNLCRFDLVLDGQIIATYSEPESMLASNYKATVDLGGRHINFEKKKGLSLSNKVIVTDIDSGELLSTITFAQVASRATLDFPQHGKYKAFQKVSFTSGSLLSIRDEADREVSRMAMAGETNVLTTGEIWYEFTPNGIKPTDPDPMLLSAMSLYLIKRKMN